jgi:glycosyltransferase involved in cell wall biosynthesis
MVEKLTRELKNLNDVRILVADDGSTDQTFEILTSLVSYYPQLVVSAVTPNMGRGRLIRQMWSMVTADVYVYMDSDLATDLDYLPSLIASIEEGWDIATGSRYMRTSRLRRPFLRYLVSRMYNRLVNVLFRESISDHQCGFKALSKRAVKILLPICLDQKWFWDTEVLVLGRKLGLTIRELPIAWVEKKSKRTPLRRLLRDIAVIAPSLFSLGWRIYVRRAIDTDHVGGHKS